MESYYFWGQDKFKQLSTSLSHTQIDPFGNDASAVNNADNIDHMDVAPIAIQNGFTSLSGEGVWQNIPQSLFPNEDVIVRTFVRPDPQRSYAIVSLVKIDSKKISIGTEAGLRYPANLHKIAGPGKVPASIQQSNMLIAAFNGGFQEKDGEYGMIVGDKTYVPLKLGIPAVYLFEDGSLQFVDYMGQLIPPGVAAIRQNGPYLVHNGLLSAYEERDRDTWGRTLTNSLYTWRSGLGVAKDGSIIFAAGESLIPTTLAKALLAAGAVDAIQLDINPPWVRFFFYTPLGNGQYSSRILMKNMSNAGQTYLTGYEKDFFYLYKK
ncbi:hypothetical protein C5B42_01290 [Candidatus Cerribacteria bacterium 'Amazon FNV 2010 28 9']|uniref:Phosphodiester glycosidase domain-containing protein n=1 Tax=Candidatus Cerribacteria bacterium 'Amazon FNV 2010 28 9' TaxID=2081795 RepID=A0A317JTU4_9BACT|nr:MAG: hypothetical protein C5B42_01290 [Candidatus Cerribacteria bacterium 'Amazon FNV 2010 28 9']